MRVRWRYDRLLIQDQAREAAHIRAARSVGAQAWYLTIRRGIPSNNKYWVRRVKRM